MPINTVIFNASLSNVVKSFSSEISAKNKKNDENANKVARIIPNILFRITICNKANISKPIATGFQS